MTEPTLSHEGLAEAIREQARRKEYPAEYKIADAVDILRNEGYYVTASKLRQYEGQDLLAPQKTDAQYRLYSNSDLDDIRRILFLREIGFPLRKIKKYFTLYKAATKCLLDWVNLHNQYKPMDQELFRKVATKSELKELTEELNQIVSVLGELLSFMQQISEEIRRKWEKISNTEALVKNGIARVASDLMPCLIESDLAKRLGLKPETKANKI